MWSKVSKLVSILFHPVFALFSGLLILSLVPTEPMLNLQDSVFHYAARDKKNLFILFGTFTVLFPITSILTLYSTKAIKSLELKERKERILPAVLVMVIHGVLYYFLRKSNVPLPLMSSLIGVVIGFALFLIINAFYKISLHGIGAGIIFGFVFSYYKLQAEFSIVPLLIIACLIGVVGWARVHQKAHKLSQYFLGVVLGIITQMVCIILEFKV